MRKVVLAGLTVLALFTGMLVGYAQSNRVAMRGSVKDANTVSEEIQYWEIRDSAGVSLTITGHRDLPVIAWLRNAKERQIVLTIAADE